MASMLTDSLVAIVASLAGAGLNPGMVIASRQPRRGPVTTITRSRSLDMVGMLTLGRATVMARCTCAGLHSRMVETGSRKTDGSMAGIASRRGLGVFHRFEGGRDPATRNVALRASSRRAFEHAAHMARLAPGAGMRTGKRKTGFKVIERDGAPLLRSGRGGQQC
jgi:hypothetical protein